MWHLRVQVEVSAHNLPTKQSLNGSNSVEGTSQACNGCLAVVDLLLAFELRREVEVADQTIHQQHCSPCSVLVSDAVRDRVRDQLADVVRRWETVAVYAWANTSNRSENKRREDHKQSLFRGQRREDHITLRELLVK